MHRPVWFRAVVAAWSLWFGAMLSEPGALHTCPTHGNHAAHAGPMQHGAGGHHDPAQKTHCTCLGDCCCSAPPPAPAAIVIAGPIAQVVRVDARVVATVDVAPVSPPPHARPFANGPPVPLLG